MRRGSFEYGGGKPEVLKLKDRDTEPAKIQRAPMDHLRVLSKGKHRANTVNCITTVPRRDHLVHRLKLRKNTDLG